MVVNPKIGLVFFPPNVRLRDIHQIKLLNSNYCFLFTIASYTISTISSSGPSTVRVAWV